MVATQPGTSISRPKDEVLVENRQMLSTMIKAVCKELRRNPKQLKDWVSKTTHQLSVKAKARKTTYLEYRGLDRTVTCSATTGRKRYWIWMSGKVEVVSGTSDCGKFYSLSVTFRMRATHVSLLYITQQANSSQNSARKLIDQQEPLINHLIDLPTKWRTHSIRFDPSYAMLTASRQAMRKSRMHLFKRRIRNHQKRIACC